MGMNYMYAYDYTNEVWRKVNVNAYGQMSIKAIVDELDDIGDVYVPTPADLYILYWDNDNSRWACRALSDWTLAELGTKVLNDLDNVNAPTPSDGEALIWDAVTSKWIPGVAGAPTKEFFIPATNGTEAHAPFYETGYRINTSTDAAFIMFFVPHDFTSITDAVVMLEAATTATHRLNFFSTYGANGEKRNTHSESDLNNDLALTLIEFYEFDISGILSNLAANDYVGIRVLGDAVNVPDVTIIGVRFKYS